METSWHKLVYVLVPTTLPLSSCILNSCRTLHEKQKNLKPMARIDFSCHLVQKCWKNPPEQATSKSNFAKKLNLFAHCAYFHLVVPNTQNKNRDPSPSRKRSMTIRHVLFFRFGTFFYYYLLADWPSQAVLADSLAWNWRGQVNSFSSMRWLATCSGKWWETRDPREEFWKM